MRVGALCFFQPFQQHLPGAGQYRHGKFLGHVPAACTLDLGRARRIGDFGRDLDACHPIGDIEQILLEKRYIRKDGEIVWGRFSASLLRDTLGDPLHIVAHLQNLTEQKQIETDKRRLEIQTQVAQRMESIGTLAGGIAHDFNNILMSIQGNISLLRSTIKGSRSTTEKLQTIEHYIQSGAKLTQQLLGFARSGKYEVKTLELNSVIEKERTLGNEIKELEEKRIELFQETEYEKLSDLILI